MLVTIELLKDWGICERVLRWFEKTYPNGVEDSVQGLLDRMTYKDSEPDKNWFLGKIAIKISGQDGLDALRIVEDRVGPLPLATIIVEAKDKDTGAILGKVLKSEDRLALYYLVKCADTNVATECARKLKTISDGKTVKEYENMLSADGYENRKTLFKNVEI